MGWWKEVVLVTYYKVARVSYPEIGVLILKINKIFPSIVDFPPFSIDYFFSYHILIIQDYILIIAGYQAR